MNPRECGFLLLSSKLGDPDRKPLTTAQLRLIAQRAALLQPGEDGEQLNISHLLSIGIEKGLAEHVLLLLKDTLQLQAYLDKAKKLNCFPIARVSEHYPLILRKRLGFDAPGCLWAKGNPDILKMPGVSLVGSRDLHGPNRKFAKEVGIQAAKQGFALVSGNARGADYTAQSSCLEAGGSVISVLADSLIEHPRENQILYISEEGFDEPFSSFRALHRNHIIHAWSEATFVAQCSLQKGGTWDGSAQNLRKKWSPLYCLRDGSAASLALEKMGATLIECEALADFKHFADPQTSFL